MIAAAARDWEDIGEVSDVVISRNGKTDSILLDIGGFLGIGEKTVATTLESLTIIRAADNSKLRVYVDATKERLEEKPNDTDS